MQPVMPARRERFSERLLAFVTPSTAKRFESYAERVRAARPGERVTDGEVVRHLIHLGLDAVERSTEGSE